MTHYNDVVDLEQATHRHYSQVVTATDSNEVDICSSLRAQVRILLVSLFESLYTHFPPSTGRQVQKLKEECQDIGKKVEKQNSICHDIFHSNVFDICRSITIDRGERASSLSF